MLLATMFLVNATTGTSGAAQPSGFEFPDVPRDDTPVPTDGRVYAGAQVGNRILVGGTFTSVEPQNGQTPISQSYLYVYDRTTGALDTSLLLQLDGPVYVITPAAEADQVYIGGKFNTIDGVTRRKIAKLDLDTGQVVSSFVAQSDGVVRDIAVSGGRVYMTGGFNSVNGITRSGLAAVDATTGVVATDFDLPLTTYIGQIGGPIGQRIAVTPDGNTLIVMHRAQYIDGLERRGVAMVDISASPAAVTAWRTHLWDGTVVSIADGEVSPDGTYLVVSGGWGDSPPWRDTAIAFPVAGGDNTDYLWVTRNFDTTFALGISDDAVYIGGHFCWTEGPDAADPWPNPAHSSGKCPNKPEIADGAVYRNTIAALDPATGHAIEWVPWSDANNGIRTIEVVPAGLLIGGDQTWTSDIRTGRSALFDVNDAGPTDLALAGTSTQSSTKDLLVAERASDGGREGEFFTETISRTIPETRPWWESDLGAVHDISEVVLWNTTENTSGDLADVWVFVSDNPFTSTDPTVTQNQAGVTTWFLAGSQGRETKVAVGRTGRYVRVQLDGTAALALSEVQILEGAPPDTQAPSSVIDQPVADSIIPSPVSISGTATDNVGVTQVIVEVRNRDTGQWLRSDGTLGSWMELSATLGTPGGASTTWQYDTPVMPDGRYRVYVRAVDAAGNQQVKINRKFVVAANGADTEAPVAVIDQPLADSTIPSPVTMSGTATDNVGVTQVVVELRNRDTGQWLRSDGTLGSWMELDATLGTPGGTSTTWQYVTPSLPAGRYKMFIKGVDAAGNLQTEVIRKFVIS